MTKEQEETTTVEYGLGNPDAAGAPGLENMELLDEYWDGNLSLPEAQALDVLSQSTGR